MTEKYEVIKNDEKERGYSKNFSKALIAMEQEREISNERDSKHQIRIAELNDFVSRIFLTNMIPYALDCNDGSTYFRRMYHFVGKYYPDDHFTYDEIKTVFALHGIYNHHAWISSAFFIIPIWLCALVYIQYALFGITWSDKFEVANYVDIFLSLVISAIVGMGITALISFVIEKSLKFFDYIRLSIKVR